MIKYILVVLFMHQYAAILSYHAKSWKSRNLGIGIVGIGRNVYFSDLREGQRMKFGTINEKFCLTSRAYDNCYIKITSATQSRLNRCFMFSE